QPRWASTRPARWRTRTPSSEPATTSRASTSRSSTRPSTSGRRQRGRATTPSSWPNAGSDDRSGRSAREERGQLVVAAREVIGDEHDQDQSDRDRGRPQPEARPVRAGGADERDGHQDRQLAERPQLFERMERSIELIGDHYGGGRRPQAEAQARMNKRRWARRRFERAQRDP